MRESSTMVLLRTMLRSTSRRNIYIHCRDKKRRGKIIGAWIGMAVLYFFLMVFCGGQAVAVGYFGYSPEIPSMSATLIGTLAFVLCVFRVNGYLFRFKEYDMLMAMPFQVSEIVRCKLLAMYFQILPMLLCVSIPMLIGYGITAKPPVWVYPVWIVLSLAVPIVPMVAASMIGFLAAGVSVKFKYKRLIQTVLMFVFLFLCVAGRFVIEATMRENQLENVVEKLVDVNGSSKVGLLLTGFFEQAVRGENFLSAIWLILISVAAWMAFYLLVAKYYRKINSKMVSYSAKRGFRLQRQKERGVIQNIAFKELKRLLGSSYYMLNAGFGQVMVAVVAIAALFVNIDEILAMMMPGAPVTKEMLLPALPPTIYMMVGMVATTCCTPSLEGKNYWIVQSFPIDKMDLYKGKMYFNMLFTVPFFVPACIILGIRFGADPIDCILFALEGLALCTFSTVFGMVCGIRYMRLDWENEIEVIKQSTAVAVYIFPNLFGTMGIIVGSVILGTVIGAKAVSVIITVVAAMLAGICYLRVKTFVKKQTV